MSDEAGSKVVAAVRAPRSPRRAADVPRLADGVRRGERACVARLLTLVEEGDEASREAVAALAAAGARAYTIGITGAPGVGKSSLTDRLITRIRQQGDSVSVLAVDPS